MRTLRHRWLLSAALAALMLGASGVSAPPAWSAPTSPPPSSQSQPEVTTSDGDHIDPTTTGSAPQEDAPATTATSARSATAEATSDAGSASTPAPATAPATVRAAAPTGVKVVEAGSIALTPKLSTDADTSGCASAHTCRPTAITAGLLDKTLVDNPATTPPDYSRQTWYAPDDVVIHVPQRADGYTLPRATNGGALATIAGTDPPQTVADYLKNAPPDNLLVGVNGGMSTAAGAESLPNSPFYSSIRSNGGLSFVLDGTPVLPEGGRLTVSKPATTDSPIWDSAGGTQTSFSPGKAVLINVALGWTFSVPGVYCAAVTETASMDATDDAPATTLTAKGSYTFVVGDTVDPATVTPCTQPSDGGSGPGDQTRVITDSSHHDIRIFRSGNQFTFGLDTSGPPLSRVLWANTPAPKTVEAPTDTLDMTAVGPVGTKYWYFPHSAVDDTPWPGISAESLSVNDYASPVTFRFLGFSRNGEANPAGVDVAMLADVTTSSRAMSLFNSRLGYPTAFQAPPRTHFHPYWTFTQPGVYCLAIQATGKLADGTWASGDGQITMVVGGAADGVPDPSTVVPCERNGQPLPVAAPNTSVHPVDSTGVYRATNDEFIELGLTDNNLRAVASTTSSVNTPPAYRDPDDVILSTSSYNQQNEAWRYGGDGYKDFGFDLSSLDPARLRGGVATVGLGDVDGPGTVTTANTGDWGTSTSLSSAPGGNSSFTSIGRTRIGAAAAPFFWYFSAAGVYCVPITVDATLTDGTSTHVAKTLTFIAGNTTDPTAADYVNPADVTTCSRGQTGQAATQPGDGDGGGTAGHDDIYVDNDSLTDSGAVILNDGHVDLASKLRDGTLETWVKDTTETTEPRYHPLTGSNALSSPDRDETNNGNGAVFQLLPESQLTVPDNSAYSFLGDPGAPVWVVSQTQQPGLLWPGWSTEEIPTDATQTGVRWKLDRVNGPGEFALYENELASVDVLFNTRDGITDADSLEIAKNAHVHGSWAFSAEGTYCLGFTRSTTLANGATASDDFTLAVAVGRVAVRKVDPGKCFSAPGQPGTQDLTPVPDDQLTDATTGGVQVLDAEHGFNPGQLVTAQIGASHAGEWVSVWLHSAPTWLGWTQVGGSGAIQVRLPSDAEPGAHKLVVKNADLQLLGWDALTLVASSDGDGGGGGDGTPPGGGGQGTPPPQCTAKTTIISSGHLDYSTQVKGGKVESLIGDNSSGQEVFREPSRTVLWLKPSSKVSLPSGYEAVGPAGSTVYMVPQTQNMDLIWLGW
ncbi:MAG TPA: TIGR03773 family transporter-associated surface protein, partial [Pseudonocardiaceae bacterium]